MEALIILFATGILTMFIAMAKNPLITLLTAATGLIAAGSSLVINYHHPINFANYEGLYFDQTSVVLSVIVILFTLLLILIGYVNYAAEPDHTGDYMALMLFSSTGALCLISFTDLFMFFIGLEILSIPVYVLAGSKKKDLRSTEASIKYFFTGAFSTGVLLFGIALVFGATGSFKVFEIQQIVENAKENVSLLNIGILMILASFLFKVGAAPFHFWSPDVYEGSPNVTTGYMAAVVKFAGFFAFFKMFAVAFQGASEFWGTALMFLSVLTMFVGNLSALNQSKFKRLIAYSSITHVGYALLAILSGNFDSLFIYLTSYGFSIIALIAVSLIVTDKDDKISSYKGLANKYPYAGVVAIVALLSLAGVPPLFGFVGKFMVFGDAFTHFPALVIIAIINSGIGIYYYLRTILVLLAKNDEPLAHEQKAPSMLAYFVMTLCLIAILFGGLILI